MLDQERQAGANSPDAYLDYDPLPYELAIRAAYSAQGYGVCGVFEKASDKGDAIEASSKLLGNVGTIEGADMIEND